MNLITTAQIIKFHNDRIQNNSPDYRKLGWRTTASQLLRFQALANAFNLNHSSVLDIGCGYADFKTYLAKQYRQFSYTGIDINPAFIKQAAQRFAGDLNTHLIWGDFETTDFTPADYVFTCGALSYANPDPYFPGSMIKKMWNTARKGIAFTLLNRETFPDHPLLKAYSKNRIITFCQSFASNIKIVDHYLPDDFTIVITKGH